MNDLWPEIDFDDEIKEESNAIPLLREQARLLEKKTQGKIKATFSKVEYMPGVTSALSVFANAIVASQPKKEEIIETELQGKQDIGAVDKLGKISTFLLKYGIMEVQKAR